MGRCVADLSSKCAIAELSLLQEFSDAKYDVSCDLMIFRSCYIQEVFSLYKVLDVDWGKQVQKVFPLSYAQGVSLRHGFFNAEWALSAA